MGTKNLLEDTGKCMRLKKYYEQYSKAEEDKRLLVREQEANCDAMTQQNEYKRTESTCRREFASCHQVFDEVADNTLHGSYDALLLPSVTVPDSLYSTATQKDLALPVAIKGVDPVAVVSAFQLEQEKKEKARKTKKRKV